MEGKIGEYRSVQDLPRQSAVIAGSHVVRLIRYWMFIVGLAYTDVFSIQYF